MKKLMIRNTYTFIIYFFLFCILLVVSSCNSSDSETDRQAFIKSLTHTWEVTEDSYIFLDDQNITDAFLGFEITINDDLTYVTNSDELATEEFPWGTSGSFTLNDALTQLTREDGLVITLELTDTVLDIEFDGSDATGRETAISGGWKCGLSKKE